MDVLLAEPSKKSIANAYEKLVCDGFHNSAILQLRPIPTHRYTAHRKSRTCAGPTSSAS